MLQPTDWPCVPLLLQVVRRTVPLPVPCSHRALCSCGPCCPPRAQRDGFLRPSLRRQGGCAHAPCGRYSPCTAAVASQRDCRAAHSFADRSPLSVCWCSLVRSWTRDSVIVSAATAHLSLAATPMCSPLSGALGALTLKPAVPSTDARLNATGACTRAGLACAFECVGRWWRGAARPRWQSAGSFASSVVYHPAPQRRLALPRHPHATASGLPNAESGGRCRCPRGAAIAVPQHLPTRRQCRWAAGAWHARRLYAGEQARCAAIA